MIPAFYPASAYGGTVEVAYRLSKELVKRGHEVTVYTSDTLDKNHRVKKFFSEIDGIKVYYFRNLSNRLAWKRFIFNPTMIYYLNKEAKNFDIIHLHGSRNFQNILAYFFSKKYAVPYVLHAHGSLPKIGKQSLKNLYDILFGYKILKTASKVIALTNIEANQYLDFAVPNEKIMKIPNGIDLSSLSNFPQKGLFKQKFKIDANTRIVLYLGRIHEIKGVDILIKAFVNVVESVDKVILVIVGPDDGFLDKIRTLIRTLKIDTNVLIVGPLYGKDKFEVYVDATIVVVPSRYEIFGNVVLESYSCYKPVVASKVAGLQEIVLDEKTGLLVKPGDVAELSSSILRLLSDEKNIVRMGILARRLIEKKFRIEEITKKLENTYLEILREKATINL